MSAVAKPRRPSQLPTYATSAPPLLSLPGSGTLVDATLGDLTDAQQRALAGAQMAWLARQAATDARLAAYSRVVTLDELEAAVVTLRSFFLWGEQSGAGDPTLRGAFLWLRCLAQQAYDYEARGLPSPLPLRWMARSELDTLEALDEDTDTEPPPPRPIRARARRKPRARRDESMTASQNSSGKQNAEGKGRSDDSGIHSSASAPQAATAGHSLALLAPAIAVPAPRSSGNKGGRTPRRRRRTVHAC